MNLQVSQTIQLQSKNGIGLALTEAKHPYQVVLGILAVLGSLDCCNDFIQDIERLDQPFQDMSAVFCTLQVKLGAAGNYFALVGDIRLQDRFESELLRRLVNDRHHVEVIGNLQIGFLEQVSQNALSIRFLLQFHHNTQAIPAALVPHFCDTVDLLLQTDILHRGNKT
ncbi:hypothetical protein D3C75_845950 [compost metagenome]